jgi:hypothetical protein
MVLLKTETNISEVFLTTCCYQTPFLQKRPQKYMCFLPTQHFLQIIFRLFHISLKAKYKKLKLFSLITPRPTNIHQNSPLMPPPNHQKSVLFT